MSGRCRKHCLHPVTPAASVCCHCGRAANHAALIDWPFMGRWVPREQHGEYLFAAQMTGQQGPGWSEIYYTGHPLNAATPLILASGTL